MSTGQGQSWKGTFIEAKMKGNICQGQNEKKHLSRPKWKETFVKVKMKRNICQGQNENYVCSSSMLTVNEPFYWIFKKRCFYYYFLLYSEICLQPPVWQYYWCNNIILNGFNILFQMVYSKSYVVGVYVETCIYVYFV